MEVKDTERLIELASRPLADNAELQLASVAILQERLAGHAPSENAVAEAIEAFERADRNPRRRHWRTWMYLAAIVAALAAMVFSALQAYQTVRFLNGVFGGFGVFGCFGEDDFDLSIERHTTGLSPEQKLLLLGREGAANEADRWKPLWESAPENPAFLAQYAAPYCMKYEKLSPEILDAADRIDPNNGWYPALSAGWIIKETVKSEPLTTKARKENKPSVWEIKDKSKLEEALKLIHQAAEKTEFNTYESAMLKQRIPLLPPRTDWASQFPRVCYVAQQKSYCFRVFNISKALGAGAQECATNKDIEGFRRIVEDWRKLGPAITRNGSSLMDLLVAKAFFTTPLNNFRATAHSLGLEEEAAHFAKLAEAFAAHKEACSSKYQNPDFEKLVSQRATMLARLSIPVTSSQVKVPPPLTDADLRPSRYAEHAFFSRLATSCAWVVFVAFIGLAALCRLFKSPLVRTLSFRMTDLLRLSDWLWIVIAGILLPMLWYLFIVHLTPLGSREWSIMNSEMFLPTGQLVALVILTIILPWMIAGWRLGKRGAMFGLKSRFQWIGWLAVGSAAAAIPTLGAGMLIPQTGTYDIPRLTIDTLHLTVDSLPLIALVFAIIPATWLMGVFFLNLFGHSEQSLRRAALSGLMIPAWTLGILAFTAWTPFLYALECHWMKQDRLLEMSAHTPALCRYEYDVTQILRAEILEIVDQKP